MKIRDLFRKSAAPQDNLGPKTAKEPTSPLVYVPTGTKSGILVSEEQALSISAVFSAIRILSEDIASLPLHLYFVDGESRRRAVWRPEYVLLNSRPNSYQTAFELRETIVASLLLRGKALCEIERNLNGDPIGMHFVEPDRYQVRLDINKRQLYFTIDSKQRLEQEDVLYFRAFSTDGINGRGIITLARESIGLTAATEHFGANFFGNGATPGGVLEYPGKVKDEAMLKRLRESWNQRHQRNGGIAILEDGLKYEKIGIPPEDSQFLETRKFQVNEIARWFRIPPHMLGDLERATFSNIEEQSLEYVKHTLRPWLVRIEQGLRSQLLPFGAQGAYYFEHMVDGLLRGDIKGRFEAYALALQNGWLSINEVRKKENMNPVDGGDVHRYPLNTGEVGEENNGT